MKTPEEIKKGLERCQLDKELLFVDCSHCPYYMDTAHCDLVLHADTLTYIQQLEAELKSYKAEAGVAQRALESARQELAAVKRERDAAVIALHGNCEECRHEESIKCASCIFNKDAWNIHDDNWQWCGVCPENTEVQK